MRIICVALLLSIGCGFGRFPGNGHLKLEKRPVETFQKLEIAGVFEVKLKKGDAESLTIETDENLMEHVVTEVRGGRLIIKHEEDIQPTKLIATVTYKEITEIVLAGAVELSTDSALETPRLKIEAAGASIMNLNIMADQLTVSAAGTSTITLRGQATSAEISAMGALMVRAFELEIGKCEISLAGAGRVNVSVTDELEVDIAGAGEVIYRGNPKITKQEIAGAGTMRRE